MDRIDQIHRVVIGIDAYSGDAQYRTAGHELLDIVEALREALEEIAKGEGAFNRDPLVHCANAVEAMKATANTALANLAVKP